MNDKVVRNRKIANVLIGSFFVLAILIAAIVFIRDAYLETRAIETEAKIVSIDYIGGKRYATVTYEIENVEHKLTTPLDEEIEDITVNEKIKVKYDYQNPEKGIYNDHLNEITITILISIIGIIITGRKASNVIRDYIYINKLKKDGISIKADITEVFVDTSSPQAKKSYPYRLKCKYLNPQDNKTYTYLSNYTYVNINPLIKSNAIKKIIVYIDKNNTNKYYVDLDSLFIPQPIIIKNK